MIDCPHCGTPVDETDRKALTQHFWTHRIGGPKLIIQYFHGGVHPTCGCGCGELMKYDKVPCRFSEYALHHKSRADRMGEGFTEEQYQSWLATKKDDPFPVIFRVCNKHNGKSLVGQATYWPSRLYVVMGKLSDGTLENEAMQGDFNAQNGEGFSCEVLETGLGSEDLSARRAFWTAQLGTHHPNGYNEKRGWLEHEQGLSRNEQQKIRFDQKREAEDWVDRRNVAPREERVVRQPLIESFDTKGNPFCVACQEAFRDKNDLIAHFWHKHRVNGDQTILHFFHQGVIPVCKCGCGEEVCYSRHFQRYNEYVSGHNDNHEFMHTPEALIRTREGMRRAVEMGVFKASFTAERRHKISERVSGDGNPMFGKEHTAETKAKMGAKSSAYNSKPESRAKVSRNMLAWWNDPKHTVERKEEKRKMMAKNIALGYIDRPKTKLEADFELMLTSAGISYTYQFNLCNFYFDFIINDTNILLEVHGDFYHVNPEKYPNGATYKVQRDSQNNDVRKNVVARREGYEVLYFWELDIRKNTEQVTQRLEELCLRIRGFKKLNP